MPTRRRGKERALLHSCRADVVGSAKQGARLLWNQRLSEVAQTQVHIAPRYCHSFNKTVKVNLV